jgi:hypothetical protein
MAIKIIEHRIKTEVTYKIQYDDELRNLLNKFFKSTSQYNSNAKDYLYEAEKYVSKQLGVRVQMGGYFGKSFCFAKHSEFTVNGNQRWRKPKISYKDKIYDELVDTDAIKLIKCESDKCKDKLTTHKGVDQFEINENNKPPTRELVLSGWRCIICGKRIIE